MGPINVVIIPKQWVVFICLAMGIASPDMVHAVTLPFGPDLKANGWNTYTPRGKEPARFSIDTDGALRIQADQAVAFLYRPVPKEAARATALSWQWQVEKDFPPTDLSKPGFDDRPLAVHVFFSDKDAGLLRRLTGSFGRFLGLPVQAGRLPMSGEAPMAREPYSQIPSCQTEPACW